MPVRFKAGGDKQLRQLQRQIDRAGKGIRTEVGDQLRQPIKALYQDIRHNILAARVPAEQVRTARRHFRPKQVASKGLRAPTAQALSWRVITWRGDPQAHVEFSQRKIPARVRPLGPFWIGRGKHNRAVFHPIFDHGVVEQRIPKVWKVSTAQRAALRQSARTSMKITKDRIEGH